MTLQFIIILLNKSNAFSCFLYYYLINRVIEFASHFIFEILIFF